VHTAVVIVGFAFGRFAVFLLRSSFRLEKALRFTGEPLLSGRTDPPGTCLLAERFASGFGPLPCVERLKDARSFETLIFGFGVVDGDEHSLGDDTICTGLKSGAARRCRDGVSWRQQSSSYRSSKRTALAFASTSFVWSAVVADPTLPLSFCWSACVEGKDQGD